MWSFLKKRSILIIAFLALLTISWQNKDLQNPHIIDYIISNANELKEFAESVNKGNSFEGKTFTLANDIILTKNWNPIGDAYNPFQGIFDGGGYTISGLNVDSAVLAGLFGNVGEKGQIKNINVVAKKIKGTISAGGLAGIYSSEKPIENSSVRADSIVASNYLKNSYSGGLVGFFTDESKVKYIVQFTVSNDPKVFINTFTISNSYAVGKVYALNSENSYSGGLAGASSSFGSKILISNSYFNGDVLTVGDFPNSGGLVGSIDGIFTISNSYADGKVFSVGLDEAFSGFDELSLSGGLIGSVGEAFVISNCYSNANTLAFGTYSYAGGLIGFALNKFNISNSYYNGMVMGQKNYGGIFGIIEESGNINSVYYNFRGASKATGHGSPNGITGIVPEYLKKQEISRGWDFENIWKIDSEINEGYPYLRWSEKFVREADKAKAQTKKVSSNSGGIGDYNSLLSNLGIGDYNTLILNLGINRISNDTTRSKKDIMQIVNARMYKLRNIYNDYLKLKPGFSGKVILKFTIVPSGEILKIDILSSTTEYPEFDIAIKNMVATWRWKAIYKGNVTPTIPFNFTE